MKRRRSLGTPLESSKLSQPGGRTAACFRDRDQLRRILLVCLAAMLVLSPATDTSAVDVFEVKASASLDATIGLDRATQQLIARMPKEVHKATLALLKEALPEIDKSVNGYLEKVDEIIGGQIDHFSCSLTGSAKTLGDMLGKALTKGKPRPVSDLKESWEKTATAFRSSDSPERMVTVYADFLFNATVTACQVKGALPAEQLVAEVQADARKRWTIWRRLEGKCGNSDTCFIHLSEKVKGILVAGDPRDLESVKARNLYSKVRRPESSQSVLQGIGERLGLVDFHQRPYEDQMQILFLIEDRIAWARLARETIAEQLLDSAKSRVDLAERRKRKARRLVHRKKYDKNKEAIKIAKVVIQAGSEINQELDAAVVQVPVLDAPATKQRKRYKDIEAESRRIIDDATKNQTAIKEKEAERRRRAKRRESSGEPGRRYDISLSGSTF